MGTILMTLVGGFFGGLIYAIGVELDNKRNNK